MINNMFILCILLILSVLLTEAYPSKDYCRTPDHRNGKCVPIHNCNSLHDIFRRTLIFEEDHILLEHSRCGSLKYYVCCPHAEVNINRTEGESETQNLTQDSSTSSPGKIMPEMLHPTTGIGARKCNEYKEFAYETIRAVYGMHTAVEIKIPKCATDTAMPLIVGGDEVLITEFPHMALVGYKIENRIEWNCGGSLISNQFVLSAAHCSSLTSNRSETYPAKYVRLGEHDLSEATETTAIEFKIVQRIQHPHYHRSTHYNDIALFKLDREVEFSPAIRPACLPEKFTVPTKATASGWGLVEYEGSRSDVLLKAELDIFSKDECESSPSIKKLYKNGLIEETMLCAGSHSDNKDTCNGDSGGPLQIHHEKYYCTYTVIGVTSRGSKCGIQNLPAFYTRVYASLSWIERTVWPNE